LYAKGPEPETTQNLIGPASVAAASFGPQKKKLLWKSRVEMGALFPHFVRLTFRKERNNLENYRTKEK
jgi:hypothetical protein